MVFLGDLGDFGSGGGEGRLVSRGLSSFSESSRCLLSASVGPLDESLFSGGPWLVPRSKNLRFNPLSPFSVSRHGSGLFEVAGGSDTCTRIRE